MTKYFLDDGSYVSDNIRLGICMGQYHEWHGKLFYWSGNELGWKYLKGLKSNDLN